VIPNSRQTLIDYCLRNLEVDTPFVDNKYYRWHVAILESRVDNQPVDYSEKHHIVPKSLGGSNEQFNLIRLTAREHFLVHLLLTKCMKTNEGRSKMAFALHRLVHGNEKNYIRNSRLYESVQKLNREHSSIRSKSYWEKIDSETRTKMRSGKNNPRYGKECPDTVRNAVSAANTGNTYRLGKNHTAETIEKMKYAARNKNEGKKWFHSVELNKSTFSRECPEGWKPGRLPGQLKGRKPNVSGMKWYHNIETKEEKYFYPGQAPEGYVLGRSFK